MRLQIISFYTPSVYLAFYAPAGKKKERTPGFRARGRTGRLPNSLDAKQCPARKFAPGTETFANFANLPSTFAKLLEEIFSWFCQKSKFAKWFCKLVGDALTSKPLHGG
jgi:hypothetical protein